MIINYIIKNKAHFLNPDIFEDLENAFDWMDNIIYAFSKLIAELTLNLLLLLTYK